MREKVNEVSRKILEERSLMNDLEQKHGKPQARIMDPEHVYLCEDKVLLAWYYDERDHRLLETCLKPFTMEKDKCPALVAESIQKIAEGLIIETTAEAMSIEDTEKFHQDLLCTNIDALVKSPILAIFDDVNY